jgi:hypothetical protein
LVRVKTEVDPTNFFRNEQSIPPLSSWWSKGATSLMYEINANNNTSLMYESSAWPNNNLDHVN